MDQIIHRRSIALYASPVTYYTVETQNMKIRCKYIREMLAEGPFVNSLCFPICPIIAEKIKFTETHASRFSMNVEISRVQVLFAIRATQSRVFNRLNGEPLLDDG